MIVRKSIVAWLFLIAMQCGYAQEAATKKSESKESPQSVEEMLLFFPSKYPSGNWNPAELRFKDVY